jgi:hypothetical protein
MTTQGTPGSIPRHDRRTHFRSRRWSSYRKSLWCRRRVVDHPPSPATDLSRIPAPGPHGVSAWIGRNERGEEVSGSGPIGSDPFSRRISGGSQKAASGPIRFRSATSGQAVRGNHDPKPFIWTKPVDQILI